MVAPVRERGLKSVEYLHTLISRLVAPVRERGLKCQNRKSQRERNRRSREGAWIEMPLNSS